jgi:hypothetical protein
LSNQFQARKEQRLAYDHCHMLVPFLARGQALKSCPIPMMRNNSVAPFDR